MTNGVGNSLDPNASSQSPVATYQRLTLLSYVLAASLPALVLYLRLVVMHYRVGDPPTLIFFLLPVIICAYLGGVWPGLLATLLSCLAAGYFLLPPLHNLAISGWMHKIQWTAMLAEGILVSLLTESLYRAKRKSMQANQLQKQGEEHLRRSRDRLSLAMDVSRLGTYDRYLSEDRMEWSERALAAMGLAPETSLSYEQYLEMLHPDDRSKMEQAREGSWKSNQDFEVELRIIWPDGSLHWLLVRGRPYRDESGRPIRSSGVIQDITQQKIVEEAQLRSQKLEALGTLAGGIAHDFNNILFSISGNAELASEDLPPQHPGQSSLNEIKKGARRAADLVRRILTFSRQQDKKREILQVETVVEEAVKMMRATLPAMIEVRTSFAPDLPPANIDSGQIHQVVVNLTTNAAHAIGDHAGTIEVLVTATEVGAEESAIRQVAPDRYVLLEVADNGCGMDRATRERIFDPFFTTKPVGKGTGLGLFVVEGIARSHGGGVTVYSEPGKGTVFHVYIPVANQSEKVEPAQLPAPVAIGDPWHVLYVDDEEALVTLVTRKLNRLGYKVTGFTDPEEALREFAARPGNFDAIVTDLAMPRLSGFDLLRQVLTLRPNIPTVMTSGYLRPEDHEMAHQIGVQEIILKPSTTEELGVALDALLRKSNKDRE
jgi:PAS domain S-box-containing protein